MNKKSLLIAATGCILLGNMATGFAKEYSSFEELIKNEPTCTHFHDGCNGGFITDGQQGSMTMMWCEAYEKPEQKNWTCTSHEQPKYDGEDTNRPSIGNFPVKIE